MPYHHFWIFDITSQTVAFLKGFNERCVMAGKPSRRVPSLSDKERQELQDMKDRGETPKIRQRAHAILLSDFGRSVNEIASILGVTRLTVCSWFARWEKSGSKGLADAERSGAPPKLSKTEINRVLKLIKTHPHSPKLESYLKSEGKQIVQVSYNPRTSSTRIKQNVIDQFHRSTYIVQNVA